MSDLAAELNALREEASRLDEAEDAFHRRLRKLEGIEVMIQCPRYNGQPCGRSKKPLKGRIFKIAWALRWGNVKHEIIGKVVNVRPGESCTLSIAHVGAKTLVHATINPETGVGDLAKDHAPVHVVADLEYGDTKSFTKIA